MSRTEDPKELEKVGPAGAIDWLADYATEDTSTAGMDEYVRLPRIKLIQGTTADELKDQFGEGSAVLVPGNALLCEKDGNFDFTPCFFWTEFWKMSSLKEDKLRTIVERNHDKGGTLAGLCRDKDKRKFFYKVVENDDDDTGPEMVECDCPDGWREDGNKGVYTGRNVEVLLFAVVISTPSHPMNGTGCILTFMKGEFGVGRELINAIKLRKIVTAEGPKQQPLWSTRWNARPGRRHPDASRKWWGFDVQPASNPNIDQADGPAMKNYHEEWKKLYSEQNLGVATDDIEGEGEPEATTSKNF